MIQKDSREPRNTGVTLCAILLLAFIGVLGLRVQADEIPFVPLVYTLSAFTAVHAVHALGWRRAVALAACTGLIAFLFEYAGVHTGLIFGDYRYTKKLGPEILNTVPVVILPAYFLVIYPGYLIGNLLTRGHPVSRHAGVPSILWASLLTALVASAWDLALEPAMVHDAQAWVWPHGGRYFGIPFHNYAGWVATTFTIALVYRLVERRIALRPLGRARPAMMLLPLLAYGGMMFGDVLLADPEGTRVIALFAMGIPLAAALVRFFEAG